jgi:hypothetical protein
MDHAAAHISRRRATGVGAHGPLPPGTVRLQMPAAEPVPDEPVAVVVAGPDTSGRSAVLATLLDFTGPLAARPPNGYLILRYGPTRRVRVEHATDAVSIGRPPQRLDGSLADRLLRHFSLIEAPETDRLGTAGTRVLVDVARRCGAVVYAVAAHRPLTAGEINVLTALATADVKVFFALTPDDRGHWALPGNWLRRSRGATGRQRIAGRPPGCAPGRPVRRTPSESGDPVGAALTAHAAVVAAQVPALSDAGWHAVDPSSADVTYLRRALVEWAVLESLRRASENPPELPGGGGPVILTPRLGSPDWRSLLYGLTRTGAQTVRRHVGTEVADINLRCLQELLFGDGCAGLVPMLDEELRALSLQVVTETDKAIDSLLDQILEAVLGGPVPEGVRRRIVQTLSAELSLDDLAGVLLVGADVGIVTVPGRSAVAALHCYQPPVVPTVLPGLAVALAGDCWSLWAERTDDGPVRSRLWVHQVLHAVQLELVNQVERRFQALREGVQRLLGGAGDGGILLF